MMKKMVVHFDREPCDIYVGRPSKYGNPFRLGLHGNRAEVLLQHEIYLQSRPDLMIEICRALPNKVLGCYCDPLACQADLLARIANGWQLAFPLLLKDNLNEII